MSTPRDAESYEFLETRHVLRRFAESRGVPTLEGKGTRSLEAWFLGPKAENLDEVERLVVEALRDHAFWRRNYHPGDPSHITEEMKRHPEYLHAMGSLKENYRELLAFLKKSVPFFSMRYQGHMNWDLTIPSIVGYFAAMLYNPNNVAFEGSTATTILELLVADDLCRMLGYRIPSAEEQDGGAIRPWGHITCDGTVANIEAMWAARNVKLYPVALHAALRQQGDLEHGLRIEVPLADDGKAPLGDLDTWQLLNIRADDVLALPARLATEFDIKPADLSAAVERHSVQNLGLSEFSRRYLAEIDMSPVILVPGTKHYSFPKAAALLGIGASNLIDVHADLDARMSKEHLEELLTRFAEERRPVYAVVAVMGTTEESALDPLASVLDMRKKLRKRGFDFYVHADGAWGGYHVSMIRDDFSLPRPSGLEAPAEPPPAIPLSSYSREQLAALGGADSITVDPHKSGYIPYPAGTLCYRNSAIRHLVSFSAPVIYHGEAEPTVGIYGIEGSKPGAAAASVYLSHSVIRPSRSGYGKIIGQALFSCKKLYVRLLCMCGPDDPFICVPVPRLPAEMSGNDEDVRRQLELIRTRILGRTNEEIAADSDAMALLSELGPDENILSYAFNFRTRGGEWNRELGSLNDFNRLLYKQLRIEPGKDIYDKDLIVSTTDLSAQHYGPAFVDHYKGRLGVSGSQGDSITVLRSVVMDPWVTETTSGSFLDILEVEFRKALNESLQFIHGPTSTWGY